MGSGFIWVAISLPNSEEKQRAINMGRLRFQNRRCLHLDLGFTRRHAVRNTNSRMFGLNALDSWGQTGQEIYFLFKFSKCLWLVTKNADVVYGNALFSHMTNSNFFAFLWQVRISVCVKMAKVLVPKRRMIALSFGQLASVCLGKVFPTAENCYGFMGTVNMAWWKYVT